MTLGISTIARQIDAFKLGLRGTRTEIMVKAANLAFTDAQRQNRETLGREPPFKQFVDGRENAPLTSVKPGGKIVYTFAVGGEALRNAIRDAAADFVQRAPVGKGPKDKHPGLYRDSLIMLVNGERRGDPFGELGELKEDDEVSLTDLVPYSRKIEIRGTANRPGLTVRVPNGVFQAMTQVLRRRYGNILNVLFSFEAYPGFAVGGSRRGGAAARSAAEVKRASRYPTIRMSLR